MINMTHLCTKDALEIMVTDCGDDILNSGQSNELDSKFFIDKRRKWTSQVMGESNENLNSSAVDNLNSPKVITSKSLVSESTELEPLKHNNHSNSQEMRPERNEDYKSTLGDKNIQECISKSTKAFSPDSTVPEVKKSKKKITRVDSDGFRRKRTSARKSRNDLILNNQENYDDSSSTDDSYGVMQSKDSNNGKRKKYKLKEKQDRHTKNVNVKVKKISARDLYNVKRKDFLYEKIKHKQTSNRASRERRLSSSSLSSSSASSSLSSSSSTSSSSTHSSSIVSQSPPSNSSTGSSSQSYSEDSKHQFAKHYKTSITDSKHRRRSFDHDSRSSLHKRRISLNTSRNINNKSTIGSFSSRNKYHVRYRETNKKYSSSLHRNSSKSVHACHRVTSMMNCSHCYCFNTHPTCSCSRCNPHGPPSHYPSAGSVDLIKYGNGAKDQNNILTPQYMWDSHCKVYIGGIDEFVTRKQLRHFCEKVGPLKNLWVAKNPPGFGFVEFMNVRDAIKSVKKLHGKKINKTTVKVQMAKGMNSKNIPLKGCSSLHHTYHPSDHPHAKDHHPSRHHTSHYHSHNGSRNRTSRRDWDRSRHRKHASEK